MSDNLAEVVELVDTDSTQNEREAKRRELAISAVEKYKSGDIETRIQKLSDAIERTKAEYYRLKEERIKLSNVETKGMQIALAVAAAIPNVSEKLLILALEDAFGKMPPPPAAAPSLAKGPLSTAFPHEPPKSNSPNIAPQKLLRVLDREGVSMGEVCSRLELEHNTKNYNIVRGMLKELADKKKVHISGVKIGTRYHLV